MCGGASDTILLTIFLRHDQSKNLESIQAHLSATGWWERFPPQGVEIVSWNVVMGIGQIVTLRLKPGDVLSEQMLSATFNIGRTPIREALQRLALEGLVRILPRKPYLIKRHSPYENT